MTQQAALEALLQSADVTTTPAVAAHILGCDPDTLRRQINKDPSALGFPVTRIGHWTRIPIIPFVRYLKGSTANE